MQGRWGGLSFIIYAALFVITPSHAKITYSMENKTVMLEYLGVPIEMGAAYKKDMVHIHKLLLEYRPNAIAASCGKYFVLSKGTREIYIIVTGKEAYKTDVWIFYPNKYNKTMPIVKPELKVIILKAPHRSSRAVMPELTGQRNGEYKAYYFLKMALDVKFVESRYYLMLDDVSKLRVDVREDTLNPRGWMAFKHLSKRDCPFTSITPFPWIRGHDHDAIYPFFIVAAKRPTNHTTIMTRTYLTGRFEVYMEDHKMIYNNTNSMEDCRNVHFESCPIFRFGVSVEFKQNSFCEYSLSIKRAKGAIYPCKLAIRIISERSTYNMTETINMMVPYDYESAYDRDEGGREFEEGDGSAVFYDLGGTNSQMRVKVDAKDLFCCLMASYLMQVLTY